MHRRSFIVGITTTMISSGYAQQPDMSAVFTEPQRGDIDVDYETVVIDPSKVDAIIHPAARATYEKKAPNFGATLLTSASQFVGRSRSHDPDDIAEILSLFNLPYRDNSGKYVAYCAAGIAFAAALGYAEFLNKNINKFNKIQALKQILDDMDHWYYYPSPSVWSMYLVSAGKGSWKPASPGNTVPLPGWIVIYDFGKGADHCGIIESATPEVLKTIEFNTTEKHGSETNGGVVARKERKYNSLVKGFIVLL